MSLPAKMQDSPEERCCVDLLCGEVKYAEPER